MTAGALEANPYQAWGITPSMTPPALSWYDRALLSVGQIWEASSWSARGHLALDVLGRIPAVGFAFDGANAMWYAIEGNWADAGFSAVAAIPGFGDAAGVGKWVKRGAGVARAADGLGDAARVADKIVDAGRGAAHVADAARPWYCRPASMALSGLKQGAIHAGVGGAVGFGAGYLQTGTWEGAWAQAQSGAIWGGGIGLDSDPVTSSRGAEKLCRVISATIWSFR